MTHAASVTSLGSEFNDFLYAPIGPDWNGMVLSVLSALARQNVDPWQEAAQLAHLQVGAATERLTKLISAIPGGPSARSDPATIAVRLIALLPHPAAIAVAPRETVPVPFGRLAAPTRSGIMFYAILMIVLIVGQFVANHHASQQINGTSAPPVTSATSTLSSPAQ